VTTIAERIADNLAYAYTLGPEAVSRAFSIVLASKVEIAHLPPQPEDGSYDRDLLLKAHATRASEFTRVMPDYREGATVATFGDEITVDLKISGTLPDGTAVAIVGRDRLTVKNGEVVRMESILQTDQSEAILAALEQP
jgi:hypothetical protein